MNFEDPLLSNKYESADEADIEQIQQLNERVLKGFEVDANYDIQNPPDRLLVDILHLKEPELQIIKAELAHKAQNSAEKIAEEKGYEIEVQEVERIQHIIIPKRANIFQFPVLDRDYGYNPYGGIKCAILQLNINNRVNAGDAGIICAQYVVKGEDNKEEKWVFVRTHSLEGWMRADDILQIEKNEIEIDKMHPELNKDIATVVAYGLAFAEDIIAEKKVLRKVNAYGANRKVENGPTAKDFLDIEKGLETWGDGENDNESENSTFSLGDQVKVVNFNFNNEYAEVKMYGEEEIVLIPKEYLVEGYLKPTTSNLVMLLNEAINSPYSWGGGDGVNHDCATFVNNVLAAFGIQLPNGSNAQGISNVGEIKKIILKEDLIMPLKAEDLNAFGIDVDDVKGKVALLQKPNAHIMFVIFDEEGNPAYVHAVGPMNIREPLNPLKGNSQARIYRVIEQNKDNNNVFGVIFRGGDEIAGRLAIIDIFK